MHLPLPIVPGSSKLLMCVHVCIGLVRGADKPGQEVAATISLKHIYEIARVKQQDTPDLDLQVSCTAFHGYHPGCFFTQLADCTAGLTWGPGPYLKSKHDGCSHGSHWHARICGIKSLNTVQNWLIELWR